MQGKVTGLTGAVIVLALAASGCRSSLAPPFDTLKDSNVVAYRLQNFEPPAAQQQPQQAAPGAAIPGVPPQITQWLQQGAQGLEQLIPPGLVPPGLMQGMQPQAPAPQQQAQAQVPRFHGFRILDQIQVIDPRLKEELAEVLGEEDTFHEKHHNCMYAEMGISFQAGPGTQPNDLLVSFSCNQVQATTFAWPYRTTGLKPEGVKELAKVVNKLWPPAG